MKIMMSVAVFAFALGLGITPSYAGYIGGQSSELSLSSSQACAEGVRRGSQCVIKIGQLPYCANAQNAICEQEALKKCTHIKADDKFAACMDKHEAICAKKNGCR